MMAQGRIVLKSISESKKLASLKTDGARLLYTWLLTHLDVNGNFSADPQVVNGKVFTRLSKSKKTIESYLDDLEENRLLIRYQNDGDRFLHVPDFVEKQPNLRTDREGKPTIPEPTMEQLRSKSGVSPAEVKLSKVKLSKDNSNSVVYDYENRTLTGLTSQDYSDWSLAFPAVDIHLEIKSACQWLLDNPTKRKKQLRRFFTNWFRRCQEKGGNRGRGQGANKGKTKLFPLKPARSCGVGGCSMPAVHKVMGEFDHFYCWEHIPAKIKAKMQEQYYV